MAEVAARIGDLRATDEIVVLDAPLLLEVGGAGMADVLVVVVASEATMLDRLARDRGMSAEDARARIASQAPIESKAAVADWLITNEGTLEDLAGQVAELWKVLDARRHGGAATGG